VGVAECTELLTADVQAHHDFSTSERSGYVLANRDHL